MLKEPPLLCIRDTRRRPSADQIACFQGVPTGFVADAMGGGGALASEISPLGFGVDIDCVAAGPALTADCRPGDVMGTLAALHFITPGDIVLAGVQGYQGCAAAGDLVVGMAKNSGASGFITDGPMRDYAGLVKVGLPVWCTGLTPGSPTGVGAGKVGFPVQIGGCTVDTGDMIVADRDGVVVVPFEQIDAVIMALDTVRAMEAEKDREVAEGRRVFDHVTDLLNSDVTAYEDGI